VSDRKIHVLTESGVLLDNGNILTEGSVVEIANECRRLLKNNDMEGFKYLMIGPPNPKDGIMFGEAVKKLSDDEIRTLGCIWIEERGDNLLGILADLE